MKQIIITILLCATALVGLRLATKPAEKAPQTVREAIEGRRSIRQYEEREVEREKLQQIAECGVLAPSAMNCQEWELRIVGSKAWIDRCTAAFVEQVKGTPLGDHLLTADFKNMFRNAPAVIFVAAKPSTYAGVNVGLLGENMMLAAYELGLGTCCLGSPVGFLNSEAGSQFLASLGFSEGYVLQYALAVGYPAEQPEAKPRDMSKIVFVE